MHEYIDIYCERTAPGFWNEPLNAISNVLFIIAALFAYRLKRNQNINDHYVSVLILALAAIGVGSFLFHSFATAWAQLADVLPILIFQVSFIAAYSIRVIRLSRIKSTIALLSFVGLTLLFGMLPQHWLNGSIGYGPALIFLSMFGAYHLSKNKNEPTLLIKAALLFAISLFFRSIDMAVCEYLSIGVHYFWHAFNALVLYMVIRALIMNIEKKI